MTRKQVWVVGLVALAGGLVGGALVSLVVSGPQAPPRGGAVQKVVKAEAFHLVAPDGTVRALLVTLPEGTGLTLYGKDGPSRAVLGVAADGTTGLTLYDKERVEHAQLSVSPDGTTRLGLSDESGTKRAIIFVSPDGSPGVGLYDEAGMVFWGAP